MTARAEYQRFEHRSAYAALEIAESAHIPGYKLAGVVVQKVLEVDAERALLAIPDSNRIDTTMDPANTSKNASGLALLLIARGIQADPNARVTFWQVYCCQSRGDCKDTPKLRTRLPAKALNHRSL